MQGTDWNNTGFGYYNHKKKTKKKTFIQRGLQIIRHTTIWDSVSCPRTNEDTGSCWWNHWTRSYSETLLSYQKRHSWGIFAVFDLGQAPCQSAARWCLWSPVKWRVEPLQETLKYLSDRRWWHLWSTADMPSRNGIQGQLILLPDF